MSAVHPSVSLSSIFDTAENLATVCVSCRHNCGLRVDVEAGRLDGVSLATARSRSARASGSADC